MGVRLGFLLLSYAVLVSSGLIALSMMFALMNTHIARSSSEAMIKNSLERNARTISSWSSSYEFIAQRTALGLLHLGLSHHSRHNLGANSDFTSYRNVWGMIGIAEMARGSVSSTFEMWRTPSPIDDGVDDDGWYKQDAGSSSSSSFFSGNSTSSNTTPPRIQPKDGAKTVLWHSTGCSHVEQRCHVVDIEEESVTYIGANPALDAYYFDDITKVNGTPFWYNERVSFLNSRNVGPRGLWSPLYIDLLHAGPATCDEHGVRGRITFYYCLTPSVLKLGALSDEEMARQRPVQCDHVLGMEADLGAVITANSLAFTTESTAHLRSVDVVDYTDNVCALSPATRAVVQRYMNACEAAMGPEPCPNRYEFIGGDVISVTGLFTSNNLRLIAVDITPENYFFYVARRVRRVTVAIAAVLIAAVVVLSVAVWMSIVTPIHRICRGMKLASKLTSANMGDMSHFTWIAEIKLLYNSYLNLRNALMELRAFVPQGLFVAPSPGALQSNSVLDMLMGVHSDEDDEDEENEEYEHDDGEDTMQHEGRHELHTSGYAHNKDDEANKSAGTARDVCELSQGTAAGAALRRDGAEEMCTECFWHSGHAASQAAGDAVEFDLSGSPILRNSATPSDTKKKTKNKKTMKAASQSMATSGAAMLGKSSASGSGHAATLETLDAVQDSLRDGKHVSFGAPTPCVQLSRSPTADIEDGQTRPRGRFVSHVLRDFVHRVSRVVRGARAPAGSESATMRRGEYGEEDEAATHVGYTHHYDDDEDEDDGVLRKSRRSHRAASRETADRLQAVRAHSAQGGAPYDNANRDDRTTLPRPHSMTETSVFCSHTNTPRAAARGGRDEGVPGGAAVLPPSLLYSDETPMNDAHAMSALELPLRPAQGGTSRAAAHHALTHYVSTTSSTNSGSEVRTVAGTNEGRSETTLSPGAAAPCLRLDLGEYNCNTFRRVDCSVIVLALDFRYANSERLSEQVELLMHVAVKAVVRWGGVLELLRPNMIIATFGAHTRCKMNDREGGEEDEEEENSYEGHGERGKANPKAHNNNNNNSSDSGGGAGRRAAAAKPHHKGGTSNGNSAVKATATQHAELAVACGVTIMRRLRPEQRAQTRIFVDSSAFYVGNCGAHGRVAPVVFGDRLDFAVDVMKYELSLGRLLLTDSVALSLPGSFVVPIDYLVTLHNRSHGIQIFQFIDHGPRRTAAFRAKVSRFRDAYTEAVRGEYAAALRELHAGPLYDAQVGTHFAHALRYLMALQPRRPRYCRFQLPPFEPLGMATKERAMRFQYEKIRLHDISSTTAPTPFIHFGFDDEGEEDNNNNNEGEKAGGSNGEGGAVLQLTDRAESGHGGEDAHTGKPHPHKAITNASSSSSSSSQGQQLQQQQQPPHLSAFEVQPASPLLRMNTSKSHSSQAHAAAVSNAEEAYYHYSSASSATLGNQKNNNNTNNDDDDAIASPASGAEAEAEPSPVSSDAILSQQPSFLCREESEALRGGPQATSPGSEGDALRRRGRAGPEPGLVSSLAPTAMTLQLESSTPGTSIGLTRQTASLLVTPPEPSWSLLPSPQGGALQPSAESHTEAATNNYNNNNSNSNSSTCGGGGGGAVGMVSLARRDGAATPEAHRSESDALLPPPHHRDRARSEEVEDMLPLSFVDHQNERWYRVPQAIGAGAFAEVYKAIAASTGAVMAVKCIHLTATHVDVGDVVREVNVACKLYNDHVVNYVDWALVSSYLMILMEYVSGGSLRSVIATFPRGIPVKLAKRYASDALRGLAYLHRSGIVHADFKPQNILLTRYGRCKISDFGSSVTKRHALRNRTGNGGNEDVFHLRGTPYYMSPEVAAGATPTMRSDIWGFGLTLYEMLTGRLPWVRRAGPARESCATRGRDEEQATREGHAEAKEDSDAMQANAHTKNNMNTSFAFASATTSSADAPALATTRPPPPPQTAAEAAAAQCTSPTTARRDVDGKPRSECAALTVHRDPCASPEVRCGGGGPVSQTMSKPEKGTATRGAAATTSPTSTAAVRAINTNKEQDVPTEAETETEGGEWVEAVGAMSEARFLQGLVNHSVQVRLEPAALPSAEAVELIRSCLQPNPARRPEAFELLNHPFFWA